LLFRCFLCKIEYNSLRVLAQTLLTLFPALVYAGEYLASGADGMLSFGIYCYMPSHN
jgi:hypothetical protein